MTWRLGLLANTWAASSGVPHRLFTTLALHPRLLSRFNALGGLFMAYREIADRDRELVILRVAARTRCGYEWVHHVPPARRAGMTEAELRRLAGDPASTEGCPRATRRCLS